MTPYVVYGIPDEQWLAAAYRSRTLKAAIAQVGDWKYVTWIGLAKRQRPELVESMRAELVVNRERAHLPRCGNDDCDRPVKARNLCKKHYDTWLASASPEEKVRRAVYPSDDQIVAWYDEGCNTKQIAERIGVVRESLRDYIKHHPSLASRVQPYFDYRLPPEEAERRNRESQRRWRQENPDVVREINRRWARNQDPAKRRRWNNYNRLRREGAATFLTPTETREAEEYQKILRQDPCVYCGQPSSSVDHIRPINKAGVELWANFAAACRSCNSQKNDEELLHYLLWRLNHGAPPGGGVANPADPVGR